MLAIYIIIIMFVLYKVGAVRYLLDLFKLPEFDEYQEGAEAVYTAPVIQYDMDDSREGLERRARVIVERQGHNPDTVKYMGDDLLIHLIRDYNECIEALSGKELEDEAYRILTLKGYKKAYEISRISPPDVLREFITGIEHKPERSERDYSKLTRKDLERICANVMCAKGCKFDVWSKVRELRDNELVTIIEQGY